MEDDDDLCGGTDSVARPDEEDGAAEKDEAVDMGRLDPGGGLQSRPLPLKRINQLMATQ